MFSIFCSVILDSVVLMFPRTAASNKAVSAATDADRLSHGSADSSTEVNGQEHNLFAHSHTMEDTTENHCSTGTDYYC